MAISIFPACLVIWYLNLPKKYNIPEDTDYFFFFLMPAEPLSTQRTPARPTPVGGSLISGIKITWNSLKMQIWGGKCESVGATPGLLNQNLQGRNSKKCVLSLALQIVGFLFYLFLAALRLYCCTWAFCNCDQQKAGMLFAVQASHCSGFPSRRARALGAQAQQLRHVGFTGAQLHWGTQNLSRQGVELMFRALGGRFSTTRPLGRSPPNYF